LNSFWWLWKKHMSVCWCRRFHNFSLKPKSSACFLDKFKLRTLLLRSPCVNKWDSNGEQFALNVRLQWNCSPPCCLWSLSESEFSSLKVRFSGGFGIGNSSLCVWNWSWPLLCLVNKSNNQMSGLLVPSKPWELRVAFGTNHLPILWEALHILHNKYERPNFDLGHLLYTQNKAHNISSWVV
jgi:hypothetical protein